MIRQIAWQRRTAWRWTANHGWSCLTCADGLTCCVAPRDSNVVAQDPFSRFTLQLQDTEFMSWHTALSVTKIAKKTRQHHVGTPSTIVRVALAV